MLIINLICVVVLFVSIVRLQKKEPGMSELPGKYLQFLKAYLILMLASMYLPLIFNRLLYGLAFLLIPFLLQKFDSKASNLQKIFLLAYSWFAIAYQLWEIYHAISL
jgi:hypothetical protein